MIYILLIKLIIHNMTEEYWANYKKNKDIAQPNQMWKNV